MPCIFIPWGPRIANGPVLRRGLLAKCANLYDSALLRVDARSAQPEALQNKDATGETSTGEASNSEFVELACHP